MGGCAKCCRKRSLLGSTPEGVSQQSEQRHKVGQAPPEAETKRKPGKQAKPRNLLHSLRPNAQIVASSAKPLAPPSI